MVSHLVERDDLYDVLCGGGGHGGGRAGAALLHLTGPVLAGQRGMEMS